MLCLNQLTVGGISVAEVTLYIQQLVLVYVIY